MWEYKMSNNYLFIDIETSGLNYQEDEIWEIYGCYVTDDFVPTNDFHCLIRPEHNLDKYNSTIQEMHTKNGLYLEAKGRGYKSCLEASEYLKNYIVNEDLVLGGFGVHFDKRFLEFYFPWMREYFHYRILDVASVRMLGPNTFKNIIMPWGDSNHRANTDTLNAVYTARYFQSVLKSV